MSSACWCAPQRVMAVADDVPIAVQEIAVRIAGGVAVALADRPVVQFQVQQGVGQRERGLVRRRVLREGGQEVVQPLPGVADQVDAGDLFLPQLGVRGRLRRFGVHALGQRVGRGGQVRLRRILAQQAAHHIHAAEELLLRFQEAGHAALPQETGLDRGSEHQVAPFVLADLVVRVGDFQQLRKRNLQLREFFDDDLEVLDHQAGRALLQVDVQQHAHGFLVELRLQVPVVEQVVQMLGRGGQVAFLKMPAAQFIQLAAASSGRRRRWRPRRPARPAAAVRTPRSGPAGTRRGPRSARRGTGRRRSRGLRT